MKYYIGYEYMDGRKTTIGNPNEKTGRMSIAGNEEFFETKDELEDWVGHSGMRTRIKVTKSELRGLCLGMSMNNFNEIFEQFEYYKPIEYVGAF